MHDQAFTQASLADPTSAPRSPGSPDPLVPGGRSPARAGFVVAWVLFWVLMTTVSVHDHLRMGRTDAWKPVLWEGTSFIVASVIVALLWRRLQRMDPLLHRPWQWFGRALAWLPLAAPAFVVAVYALRHAVYAAAGLEYRHDAWARVFAYESIKFAVFFLLWAAIFFGIRSHAAMSAERLRTERAHGLAQRAQLLQLAQQIEPHFLFNALNTIASTVHTDADLADRLLTQLATLLRAATDLARRPFATLDAELRLVEGYAAIMQARFGDRVALRFEIDPAARDCRLPALALQPLLENAYRHGVERSPGPATLVVTARRDGARLRVAVEDDVGVLRDHAAPGVALGNLRERLDAAYRGRASLTLAPRPGGGVVAALDLPAEEVR